MEQTHAANIVHGDIKPENLLLDDEGYLKLADFGVSRDLTDETRKIAGGTHGYMPGEAYTSGRCGKEMDWFAVGAVFYEILTCERMLTGHREEIVEQIRTNAMPSLSGRASKQAANLFEWLINPDFKSRAGHGKDGVYLIKKHGFFHGFSWNKLRHKHYLSPHKPL